MEMREVAIGGSAGRVRVAVREVYSGRFWDRVASGDWEPETFDFFRKHAGPGVLVLDIGAWVGPIALFAAGLGARVIALEPDPAAWAELSETVAANPELAIDIRQAAVDRAPGVLRLYPTKDGFGSSATTAVAAAGAGDPIEVPTVTLAALAEEARPEERLVLKVDIEGHEFALMDQIADLVRSRRAPTLLSLHPSAVFKDALSKGRSRLGARLAAWAAARRALRLLRGLDARPARRPGAFLPIFVARRMVTHKKGPRDFELAVTPR